MTGPTTIQRPVRTMVQRLAGYVHGVRYDDLPPDVVETTRRVVRHDLAVAFGGVETEQAACARSFVERSSGGAGRGGDGGATIVGDRRAAAPIDAAFANTVMMRALRMEDSILPSHTHPGACLIPAALAIGEEMGSSGAEVIAALVVGYDVVGAVAGTRWSWTFGNRTPSHIFNGLGVAATVAKLLRLDEEQTAAALAYSANLAVMVTYGFQDFQYGLVTRNGISAAYLGQSGGPYPADVLEGPYGFYASQLGGVPPDAEAHLATLGQRYHIRTAAMKPHPCTAINLVPLALLRALLREHRIDPNEVRAVRVRRSRTTGQVPNVHSYGPFGHQYVATSSLPFAVAALLTDGEVHPHRFLEPDDPALLSMTRLVQIDEVDGWDLMTHDVELEVADGRVLTAHGDGDCLVPPDADALLEQYGTPIVGAEKVAMLSAKLARLEQLADVRSVAAGLRG